MNEQKVYQMSQSMKLFFCVTFFLDLDFWRPAPKAEAYLPVFAGLPSFPDSSPEFYCSLISIAARAAACF
jgi:hypothetical protein